MPDLYSAPLFALHIVYIQDDSFSCNLCLRIFEMWTAFSKKAWGSMWSLLTLHCTCHGETTNQAMSEHFICTDSHQVHKPYQTLQIMASSRLLRRRLSNFTNVVRTISFQEIFLWTMFSLIFCMQTIYFTKMGTPNRKIMVRP